MRKLKRNKTLPFGQAVLNAATLVFSAVTFIVVLWVVIAITRVVVG